METLTNFDISTRILEKGDAQMSIVFYRPEVFEKSVVASFDKEDWAKLNDTQLIFVKGAFLVDAPITRFTPTFFSNLKSLKEIYNADAIIPIEANKYKVEVSKMGMSLDFILSIAYEIGETNLDRDQKEWLDLADRIDRTVPPADRVQIINQYDFSMILDQTITVNKLIPYGEQTLVVNYSLARAKQSSLDKLNSLPFINAQKILSSQLKDSFQATYRVMKGR